MKSWLLILNALFVLVAVPSLCAGGLLEHACVSCPDAEACDGGEPACDHDDVCEHEEACLDDPCGVAATTPVGALAVVPLVPVHLDPGWAAPAPGIDPALPPAPRVTPGAPPNLPYDPSDRPLRR